jgi:hypothetical protein
LVYAAGEIVLVVIGILIALAINNWKQKKTEQTELNRIISIIEKDLKSDLKQANEAIELLKPSQNLITEILYNPNFKDSIRSCEDCRYILTASYIIKFNTKGIELLTNNTTNLKSKNKSVDSILSFYDKHSKADFQFKNELMVEEVINNMKYLRDNYDWYADYLAGECDDFCLDYFESKNYMNRLTFYALIFDDFLLNMEQYRLDLEKTIGFLNTD